MSTFVQDFINDLVAIGRKRPHALVVEDTETDAVLFTALLKSLGIDVTVVPTADAAIELLKKPHDFKVVFLDLRLDGSLATWQDVAAATDTVPVVITTGHLNVAEIGVKWRHLTALQKPVQPDDIRSIFRRHNIWLPSGPSHHSGGFASGFVLLSPVTS